MITDRTTQDVRDAGIIRDTRVKTFDFLNTPLTQAELTVLERGAFTTGCINRIENKEAEIKGLLNDEGYWNTNITNTTWTVSDWMYLDDWQRVLNNLIVLRNAFFVFSDTPATPNASINFQNLNAIEKILVDIEEMISDMKSQYRKCGAYVCGGE